MPDIDHTFEGSITLVGDDTMIGRGCLLMGLTVQVEDLDSHTVIHMLTLLAASRASRPIVERPAADAEYRRSIGKDGKSPAIEPPASSRSSRQPLRDAEPTAGSLANDRRRTRRGHHGTRVMRQDASQRSRAPMSP